VTREQLRVVAERVLPAELQARGVENCTELCSAIGRGLSRLAPGAATETPDEIFRRLGGGT
jgi:hypothetical protein